MFPDRPLGGNENSPEMIDAGLDAHYQFDRTYFRSEEIVRAIFSTMHSKALV
jgi:hypothetical protein